ncbi:MAG: universal stress protein [Saprospiraceae bacterium]
MKTIIACTEFSPNANNAVQYAAALAAAAQARLVLFHHFTYPVPATDLPDVYPIVFVDDLAENAEHRLEQVKADLARTYQIEIDCVVRSLTLASDLEEVVAEEQADLVVMGIHGQSAVLNALFGNVTTAAIRRGNLPLLVVPQGVVFHPLRKILFPYDGHSIPQPETLQPLRDLALTFDAYVEVFTLFDLQKTPELVPAGAESPANSQIEVLLGDVRRGYSYENEENVDKGILYEATRSSADLVAMITHQHSFWSTLLNQSDTQRIAAHILLPLLVMGERMQTAPEADLSRVAESH